LACEAELDDLEDDCECVEADIVVASTSDEGEKVSIVEAMAVMFLMVEESGDGVMVFKKG
jgi:hypothetical protein